MIRENVPFNGFFWYRNVNLINKGYVKNRAGVLLKLPSVGRILRCFAHDCSLCSLRLNMGELSFITDLRTTLGVP